MSRAEKFAAEQEDQVLIDLEGLKLRMEDIQRDTCKEWVIDLMLALGEEDYDGEVEERYFSVMAMLRAVVQKAVSSAPDKQDGEQPAVSQRNKLPQLDVACFDGKDITAYTTFINIFMAVVDCHVDVD